MKNAGYGRILFLESQSVKQPIENLVLSNSLLFNVMPNEPEAMRNMLFECTIWPLLNLLLAKFVPEDNQKILFFTTTIPAAPVPAIQNITPGWEYCLTVSTTVLL